MRLRIQTVPPLPPLKAWSIFPGFSNPSNPNPNTTSATTSNNATSTGLRPSKTIYDLKKALCTHVPTLNEDERCTADSIVLSFEDFELLDGMPFSCGIIKDMDLLVVTLKVKDRELKRASDLKLGNQPESVEQSERQAQEEVQPVAPNASAPVGSANETPGASDNKRRRAESSSESIKKPKTKTSSNSILESQFIADTKKSFDEAFQSLRAFRNTSQLKLRPFGQLSPSPLPRLPPLLSQLANKEFFK